MLGASISGLVHLLSREFLQLVLIALIIATPIAWIGMHQWLQGFAFRTTVTWWIFGIAGLASVVIAFITIAYQAFRTALANPVRTLRTE